MKTILVTGGAGFIGSNFIFYVRERHPEWRIVCIDKLTYAGNLTTLAPVMEKPDFTFIRTDIANREAVCSVFEKEKPDIVVNFAAETHVDRSIEDPGVFLQTNVVGTQVLLDACLKKDFTIRKPRIAVLGLNPHAGENSLYGEEEKNIIIPAMEKARNNGIMALGPYSPDMLFSGVEYHKFDALLAMYHDQGDDSL